jgi:hypothetical protein
MERARGAVTVLATVRSTKLDRDHFPPDVLQHQLVHVQLRSQPLLTHLQAAIHASKRILRNKA